MRVEPIQHKTGLRLAATTGIRRQVRADEELVDCRRAIGLYAMVNRKQVGVAHKSLSQALLVCYHDKVRCPFPELLKRMRCSGQPLEIAPGSHVVVDDPPIDNAVPVQEEAPPAADSVSHQIGDNRRGPPSLSARKVRVRHVRRSHAQRRCEIPGCAQYRWTVP